MNLAGSQPTVDPPHVKLDFIGTARWIRQRERPRAFNSGQLQIDVLPCLKRHRPVELQVHTLDGRRQVDQGADHRAVVLHRMAKEVRVGIDVSLDHHVALRDRTARQHLAFITLHVHQREGRGGAKIGFALQHLDLAGGARTVAAGKRQPDALAQCGLKNGLPFFHFDLLASGFNGDLVAHRRVLS
ncbi:hypothetical protein D3C87_1638760 [compost metagenome]